TQLHIGGSLQLKLAEYEVLARRMCLTHGSETMTASEQADTQIDLMWLSEKDMIDAGVTDTAKCVETMEETLILLDKGDYRMAGVSANSHSAQINFPDVP